MYTIHRGEERERVYVEREVPKGNNELVHSTSSPFITFSRNTHCEYFIHRFACKAKNASLSVFMLYETLIVRFGRNLILGNIYSEL